MFPPSQPFVFLVPWRDVISCHTLGVNTPLLSPSHFPLRFG
uniref:Uncharacterized protein n=1 Tax=Anguilla anguilla TaxID=7936 RepID=A0A0E9RJ53_ANGAN